jgi:hypothetical protein
MRFTKILLVCLGLVLLAGLQVNCSSGTAGLGNPLPRTAFLADGGAPLPIPPVMADGERHCRFRQVFRSSWGLWRRAPTGGEKWLNIFP